MEKVCAIPDICLHCFAELTGEICPVCNTPKNAGAAFPSHALPRRTLLGERYLIADVLGTGGFGITYLTYDVQTKKTAAVKEFFPKGYAVREEGGTRVGVLAPENVTSFNHWLNAFTEEARILVRIKSLHGVVKLLDFLRENNTAYIVSDYLEGESLRAYLTAREYKITWTEALSILRPVLESLQLLHESGVLHKDVSPENIQIVRGKYVKLIDFGAATLFKRKTEEFPFLVRKEGYSPIELYKPHAYPQGPWTDVYQAGATLFNCVTGYIPPAATERLEKDRLPSPFSLGADLPVHVEEAVLKAMAILPDDRYPSIREFMNALCL